MSIPNAARILVQKALHETQKTYFHSQYQTMPIPIALGVSVTKLLFDDSPEACGHGKILNNGMAGTHAGDRIGRGFPGNESQGDT